jgi:hypothetical protein
VVVDKGNSIAGRNDAPVSVGVALGTAVGDAILRGVNVGVGVWGMAVREGVFVISGVPVVGFVGDTQPAAARMDREKNQR